MSQIYKNLSSTETFVNSVTGTNGVTASPTTGNVVVSGINATTSSVGVASFNPLDFTVVAGEVSTIEGPDLHVAIFIVNPTAGMGGNFTTIQAAINAAQTAANPTGSTIVITDGTYTEDLVFTSCNLSIVALQGSSLANVQIVGEITFVGSCQIVFQGIRFTTNVNASNIGLSTAGSDFVSVIYFYCSFVFYSNSLGFSLYNTYDNSSVQFYECIGDISDTDTQFLISAMEGYVNFYSCYIVNGVGINVSSTTPMQISSGTINVYNCEIAIGIETTGTAFLYAFGSSWNTRGQVGGDAVQTWLTLGGSGIQIVMQCFFNSYGASAISLGTEASITDCIFYSSNVEVITGTGFLSLGQLEFIGTSFMIGSGLTINPQVTQAGSLKLNGFQASNYIGVAANYQVLPTDAIVGVTSTASPITITLPGAYFVGQNWTIKDESGGAATNNITIACGSHTIDGASTYVMTNNYESVDIYWNGTQFYIF